MADPNSMFGRRPTTPGTGPVGRRKMPNDVIDPSAQPPEEESPAEPAEAAETESHEKSPRRGRKPLPPAEAENAP